MAGACKGPLRALRLSTGLFPALPSALVGGSCGPCGPTPCGHGSSSPGPKQLLV